MLLAVSIVWVISYGIQRIILGHYAAPWASFRREKLFLMGNEIEQSAFEWGYSNSYFSFSIKYSNIRQMEYSESEKILKIYGIMTAKEWDGPDRRRCIDKTTTESKDANETYLTLINYFDEFENLMKELEIRSGIPVKRVA